MCVLDDVPLVSCILEWENAEALERDEACAFLDGLGQRLSDHARRSNRRMELILVHDEDVTPQALAADIDACPALRDGRLDLRILTAPGAAYYEKKGLAAQYAQGEVILYADSDCAYGPGWIEALTGPILRDEADLCHGATEARMAPGLWPRVSALAWFFPVPDRADPLHARAASRFFANNFAVRAAAIRAVPMPRVAGSRTTGGPFKQRMQAAGQRLRFVPEAIASHRQYDTAASLFARAWVLGRDRDASSFIAGAGRGKRIRRAVMALLRQPLAFLRRMVAVGHRVLPAWQWPLAFLLGLAFQGTLALSQLWAALTAPHRPEIADYADLQARATLTDRRADQSPVVAR